MELEIFKMILSYYQIFQDVAGKESNIIFANYIQLKISMSA